MTRIAVACFGSAQHPLGVACLVTRDVDRAVEHFEAAVAHNSALGNWPAATLSRHRLAEALSLRGAPGDAKATADLYAGSAAEAAELGMRLPDIGHRGGGGRSTARVWRRSGRHWRIDLGGRSAVVEDMVGIHHLATLVANPGVDIPALALAQPDHAEAHDVTPQPVLDEEALRQYRSRLLELTAKIKQAEAMGDAEGVTALRAEADWLRHEVKANTGLGRRPRHFADSSERARIAVGKAIRRALERISAADAVIGAELRECVETGVHCSYRPSQR
jgi:hypothetical protein